MLALKLDRENKTRDTIAKFPRYIFMRHNFIYPMQVGQVGYVR